MVIERDQVARPLEYIKNLRLDSKSKCKPWKLNHVKSLLKNVTVSNTIP